MSAGAALDFASTLARSSVMALGERVAGMILHGSLVLGDYVPGRSDVDLLLVVDEPLTNQQLETLVTAAEAEAPDAPGRVDLRVVTRQVAAEPKPTPPMEAYVEIVPGGALHVETRHPGERDLAVELSMCRALGRSLVGPPPAELLAPVPDRWVLDVGDAQLADWEAIGDDPPHAELTVLTACRMWRFAEEGRHCSKTEAAEWALARDPTLEVVRAAIRRRGGDPAAVIDAKEVAGLLRLVRGRLTSS